MDGSPNRRNKAVFSNFFRRSVDRALENPTNLVSSFSLSISASFCFNERLRMLTSFLSASVER